MASTPSPRFAPRGSTEDVEGGLTFRPKFDGDGLIPAIVTDAGSGLVLMFAWMNAEALAKTIETRRAHFWSRSRRRIWLKGEESGNFLEVAELRVDCDQDALHVIARIGGRGVACHTGRESCFYRSVPLGAPADPDMALTPVPGMIS